MGVSFVKIGQWFSASFRLALSGSSSDSLLQTISTPAAPLDHSVVTALSTRPRTGSLPHLEPQRRTPFLPHPGPRFRTGVHRSRPVQIDPPHARPGPPIVFLAPSTSPLTIYSLTHPHFHAIASKPRCTSSRSRAFSWVTDHRTIFQQMLPCSEGKARSRYIFPAQKIEVIRAGSWRSGV